MQNEVRAIAKQLITLADTAPDNATNNYYYNALDVITVQLQKLLDTDAEETALQSLVTVQELQEREFVEGEYVQGVVVCAYKNSYWLGEDGSCTDC